LGAHLRQLKAELEHRTDGYRRVGFDEKAASSQSGGSLAAQTRVREILHRDADRATAIKALGSIRDATHPGFLCC
jgi:hypothetical protein